MDYQNEIFYAPVLITTLCRFDHFTNCIESLKCNTWAQFTDVFIGLDYPLKDVHKDGYLKICKYLESSDFSMFHSFNVIKREKNYGALKNSLDLKIKISEKYDRFIMAEDDICFSPNFIEYMDKCLDKFADDDTVIGVNGYSYPLNYKVSEDANVFFQNATFSAWGCGFWTKKYFAIKEQLSQGFLFNNFDKSKKNGTLRKLIKGRYYDYMYHALTGFNEYFNSMSDMALGVYMSFVNMKVVSPVLTKTINRGFDGSGVCCQDIKKIDNKSSITYNYIEQPIDNEKTFDPIVDSGDNMAYNHKLLDNFLAVPLKQKIKVWLLIVYYKIFGRKFCVRTASFIRKKFKHF